MRLLDVSSRRNPCHRVRYKRVNRVRLRTNSCRIFSNVTTKRCCISYSGYASLANKSPMTRPLDFRYFIADRINQRSELKRTNWLNWQRTKDYKWRDRSIITALIISSDNSFGLKKTVAERISLQRSFQFTLTRWSMQMHRASSTIDVWTRDTRVTMDITFHLNTSYYVRPDGHVTFLLRIIIEREISAAERRWKFAKLPSIV